MNIKSQLKEIISDKSVAILGYGTEGKSTYKLLRKYFPMMELVILDKNKDISKISLLKRDKHCKLKIGDNYLKDINDYELIFKSPGISLKGINFKKETISSQTDVFLKLFSKNTIGITGTKGKSTSSSLLYHILLQKNENVFLAGNIGLAVFDIIDKLDDNSMVVYELSSHQLEFCNHSPHIAVLLNLYEEHLDHYDTFEKYKLAKYNIAKNQAKNDFFICNGDDININKLPKLDIAALSIFYKRDIEVNKESAVLKIQDYHVKVNLDKFKLRAYHNLLNLLAVLKVLEKLNINLQQSVEHSYSFRGLEHRLEFVGNYNGISFYNDTIATIPEACISALKSFSRVDFLLLGGFNRGVNYDILIDHLKKTDIPYLILMNEVGDILFNKLEGKVNSNLVILEDIEQAVGFVCEHGVNGSICLFSPAAKTPPPLKNFKERGALFKKCIKNLCD